MKQVVSTRVYLAAFAVLFLSETRVSAYLDPGSGSMLIQLLLGGIGGAVLMLRLSWRRVRDRFNPAPDPKQAQSKQAQSIDR